MQIIKFICRKLQQIDLLLYLIFKSIMQRKKEIESDNILLVSGGGIGDAVLNASAWAALTEYYTRQGKTVFLLTLQGNWNFLKKVLDVGNITFVEGFDQTKITRRKVSETIIKNKSFDTIIGRFHRHFWTYLAVSSLSSQKWYALLECDMFRSWRSIVYAILPNRFSGAEMSIFEKNEPSSQEKIVHMAGLSDYNMYIMPLPKQGSSYPADKKYITVSVDSQNLSRRWGIRKFVELIDRLLDRFDADIFITGNNLSHDEREIYSKTYANEVRVKDVIGQLLFDDWIELLRGAQFHIGVDSGSIHIAASVGTKAFCLTGVWDGHTYFPYKVRKYAPGTVAPVCIYRKDVDVESLECFGCVFKTGKYGGSNRECLRRCRAGLPCLCLENITVDDVMRTIEETMKSGESVNDIP